MLVKLIVALLGHNLVSQETCSFRLCMCNERLFFGEFEFEGVLEKLFYLPFDLFRFSLGAGKPEERIVSIARVAESPIVRITGISLRMGAQLFGERFCVL